MLRKFVLSLSLVVGCLLAVQVAWAQEATPSDDDVNQVAKRLFCPVCENVPLDVCPTQACAQWRATIKEKMVAGWTEQQILDYFAAQYGERVLAEPSTRGLNILVWVVPPIFVLVGAVGLWRFLRPLIRPVPTLATPASLPTGEAPPVDEYLARVEQELQRRR